MLEVGNGGMNNEEYRTHMTLWALLAAPLLAGNDLTKMTPETVSLLTNRDVIAIDQDPAGMQGDRVSAEGPTEVWSRSLADGSKAVALFNRHPQPMDVSADFRQLGFGAPVQVRDVWNGHNLGAAQGEYRTRVPGHGVVLLRVSK